jgi:hypothetical protein
MVLPKNQTELSYKLCFLYYNGIVEKSNKPIIDTVLTIRIVLQKNQTDISYTLCSLLEKYCISIKKTYNRHCANYQNGIVDKLKDLS